MTSPLLVTGGTGTLGRHVVPRLVAAGCDVRVLSRRPHPSSDGPAYVVGDLATGAGVDAAVEGAKTVVHLAGGPKGDAEAARTVVSAASSAGVQHLVLISVVATERVPIGFYRAKHEAEQAVAESDVAFTLLRAAQFHELAFKVASTLAKSPLVPAPGGVRWQPVDSRDVADRLVELALGQPAGRVADLAGPREYALADLVRSYLAAHGKRRLMVPVRVPGKVGRAYRSGENLNLTDADRGKRTWEDFLAERVAGDPPAQSKA